MTTDVDDLWREYAATRDADLRERLIVLHVPLVRFAANKMLPSLHRSVEVNDLVGYGMIGLMESVDRYDINSGVKFSTYSMYRIQGAIGDEIRSQAWEPRSVRQRHRESVAAVSELEADLKRSPTDLEVASYMGLDVAEYRRGRLDMRSTYVDSLYKPIGNDEGGEFTLGATIAVHDGDLSGHLGELSVRMGAAIARMSEGDRMLLTWIYVKGLPLRTIAGLLGVTDSWVSHLHTKALVGLQRAMSAQY